MFTGLIEGVGQIGAVLDHDGFRRVEVRLPPGFEDLTEGSSVATSGVCITALEVSQERFVADLSSETLSRTTLGDLVEGRPVNLERALRADSRLGGHFVQGHVDAVGEVLEFRRRDDDWNLVIRYDSSNRGRLVPKGSVAVDGISLTVADLREDRFSAAIIPYTFEHTTLRHSAPGRRVNLEYDVLGKYVERLMEPYIEGRTAS